MKLTALRDKMHLGDSVSSPVFLWSVVLVLVCMLGDYACSLAAPVTRLLWRAMADSATHGAVAVVSWAVVLTPGLWWGAGGGWWSEQWGWCLACGVMAVVIDLDHFWQAGALDLKAAVSLQHRPPFHSTTLVIAVTALLWMVSLVLRLPQLRKVALLCLVAWLSHHLRDASRRGLWFPPFGSTPPLPYAVYVGGTVALAVLVHYGYGVWCQAPVTGHERLVEVVPQLIINRDFP